MSIKVVLIGSVGAGKTSLVKCFQHSTFESKRIPTMGAQIHMVVVNDKKIKLWDCAGPGTFGGLGSGIIMMDNVLSLRWISLHHSIPNNWKLMLGSANQLWEHMYPLFYAGQSLIQKSTKKHTKSCHFFQDKIISHSSLLLLKTIQMSNNFLSTSLHKHTILTQNKHTL
jgi:GTPase SAR1 family protein